MVAVVKKIEQCRKRGSKVGHHRSLSNGSPLEVGFSLRAFLPKTACDLLCQSFQSGCYFRFLFSFSEVHVTSPKLIRIPLQGVKGAIKARLEHASLKKAYAFHVCRFFFQMPQGVFSTPRPESRVKAHLENTFEKLGSDMITYGKKIICLKVG